MMGISGVIDYTELKVNGAVDDVQNSLTFESFIKGKSNELAYAFAKNVAQKYDDTGDKPSDTKKIFNPLIIYGDSGLGKTHLMKAIEHEVKKNHPELKIIYTTGESFINELVKALFCEVNPIPVKEALAMMGWCDPIIRSPLYRMEDANIARLEKAMKDLAII